MSSLWFAGIVSAAIGAIVGFVGNRKKMSGLHAVGVGLKLMGIVALLFAVFQE